MAPFVLPAEEAQVGAVGLLSYHADVWNGFTASLTTVEVDVAPDVYVALAGFQDPHSDRVIVVPEVQAEQPVVAFWRAGEDDLLDVVVTDPGDSEPNPGFFERLQERMSFGLVRRNEKGCTYRRTRLACAERDCKRGDCGIEGWYDERCRTRLYACVCKED